jgi:acetamidase/formamidase
MVQPMTGGSDRTIPPMANPMPEHHQVDARAPHRVWDNTISPVLEIESGATVTFEIPGGADGYFTRQSTTEDIRRRPPREGMALAGPVRVAGAEPGQTLRVEVLSVVTDDWGYSTIVPGMGLLPDEFPEPYLKIWDLRDGVAEFGHGIQVPMAPFLGVIGVAPAEPGRHSVRPPGRHGGNLDVKHLTSGSTLWLPIAVPGALVSVGDAHAAQGDGEVCGTAIETGATATLRFSVEPEVDLSAPAFITAGPLDGDSGRGPWFGGLGIGPDLMAATRDSVRSAIRYLVARQGLTREEAYVLCSVAANLRINEIVDAPNWVVSCCLPLGIFSPGSSESATAGALS